MAPHAKLDVTGTAYRLHILHLQSRFMNMAGRISAVPVKRLDGNGNGKTLKQTEFLPI